MKSATKSIKKNKTVREGIANVLALGGEPSKECKCCHREFGGLGEMCPCCTPSAHEDRYSEHLAIVDGHESPEACLGVLVAVLRATQKVEHAAHWASAYENHLLFQRLYEETAEEVDSVGEKCVGMDCDIVLDDHKMSQIETDTVSRGDGISTLLSKCTFFENLVIETIDSAWETLVDSGTFTEGVGNLLAGMRDLHETHLYLLKRATSVPH